MSICETCERAFPASSALVCASPVLSFALRAASSASFKAPSRASFVPLASAAGISISLTPALIVSTRLAASAAKDAFFINSSKAALLLALGRTASRYLS